MSIVIAARNEGQRLAARIDNLRQLDYAPDKLQVIVVSDGSTDNTAELLRRRPLGVIAIELPEVGKAQALNAGVERATNDLIVFADMRQGFAPDALRA
ncbi:MAG TPA: glycosyltransferase, partial [Vicinamibacterales bacterium]|nr:glycosyltransferase [Vicinamibacterales bacterium]